MQQLLSDCNIYYSLPYETNLLFQHLTYHFQLHCVSFSILLIWKQWKNTIPSDFSNGNTWFPSCSQSLKIGHWAGSVSTVPQEHRALFVLLPCHCQYMAFHDCKRVAESPSVTSTFQIRSKPSPICMVVFYLSEKEANSRDSTPPHWLELCHMATSGSKGD